VIASVPPAPSPPRETSLVSVIVPVYQGERLILGAVRSALQQTHSALEVWVVDDGSTDKTLERIAAIDDPRLHILRQPNAGTAAARNAALSRARGRYIAFLDADDRWFPEKIEAELAVLEGRPDPAIAYSCHYAVDDAGRLLHAARLRTHRGQVFDLLIDGEDFLMPSLCLFDRRIFERVGTFAPSCFHEDYEFILRATRLFPIYPTGQRLAVYRQTTGGKCRAILSDYAFALSEELAVVEKLAPTLSGDERNRLRRNVLRGLYLRFLMYGFSGHARRLLDEVRVHDLRGGAKASLGLLFAKTGLNLIAPARVSVQVFNRVTAQSWWRRELARRELELRYE
jgi:glycosyltransferase involved in cell wall biosynthesis